MKVGLLWYDGDPQRGLEDKIQQAARRYQNKFGRAPTLCYVNPKAIGGAVGPELGVDCRLEDRSATIRVVSAPNMLMHHFWLGEGNGQSPARQEGVSG